jgi:hypothetical protein
MLPVRLRFLPAPAPTPAVAAPPAGALLPKKSIEAPALATPMLLLPGFGLKAAC